MPRDVFINAPNAPDAYSQYAEAFRRRGLLPAIVKPLVDYHPPDDLDDGAFLGTVGVFVSASSRGALPAIVKPNGPWFPEYGGIVPISVQPSINAPEPWRIDDYESNNF